MEHQTPLAILHLHLELWPIYIINLAIYKLNKTIPPQKEIKDCKLNQAMQWIMADTGWDLQNNCSSGLFADINFDGTASSQAALQTVLSTYDAEADAYCHIDSNGIVTDLILELADQLGENEGKSITYGQNMLSVQRETVDTNLVTKLYIVGADTSNAKGDSVYKIDSERMHDANDGVIVGKIDIK
uniref:phage tail spike protein n=1 Tax=Lentilactobacillus hilgardii TaxID=1588 RepID=UPI00403FBDA0